MKECVICNEYVDRLGCPQCGKFLFREDIKILIGNQELPAVIFVTEKKMLINSFDISSVGNFKKTFYDTIFGQSIVGILLNPNNYADNDRCEIIIDMQKVKKIKYPYKTKFAGNYMYIEEKNKKTNKYIIQFPGEEVTQKVLHLMNQN